MPAKGGPVLEVRGLVAGYGQVSVLRGVSLSIQEGESVVIVGPNGHGKTTLLRAVSGLVRVRAGEVHFDGRRVDGQPAERIASLGLVHVPQGDLLFPDSTVQDNLHMGAFRSAAWAARAERIERVYEVFPRLAERRKQRARTLSGGERRMLALGRGLMAEARMLMIDEPSLGLAPKLVQEVYRHIQTIAESGITVLVIEENFSHVKALADRIHVLENGEFVRAGTVDELMEDDSLVRTYLGV
jgi:branched-chain amino acid transport system ATP-binding protein